MNLDNLSVLQGELESTAKNEMERLFTDVPFVKDFHLGLKTDKEYFVRHLIETVVRMRLDIQTDAYALYKMRPLNNKLSRMFAEYIAEEAGHDELFISDLEKFNIKKEDVLNTKPLKSTENLIGYFYYNLNHESVLLTVLWGWFVEWYSDNYNGLITEKAAQEFGYDNVKGSKAHLQIDEEKDHNEFMLKTVQYLIKNEDDLKNAKYLISRIVDFLSDYFNELYQNTIGIKLKKSA